MEAWRIIWRMKMGTHTKKKSKEKKVFSIIYYNERWWGVDLALMMRLVIENGYKV